MHIGPDPPKTGLMHPLPMPWDRGLGTQSKVACNCTSLQTDTPWEDATCGTSERRHPREGPFRLDDLPVSGQLVGYHTELARNVACSQANFPEISPGQESPQESTRGS